MTTTDNQSTETRVRERRTGAARVHDGNAWRTASVLEDAAREASHLCEQIARAVCDAYFATGESDPYAADVAASDDIRDKARDARALLLWAKDQLYYLTCLEDDAPF